MWVVRDQDIYNPTTGQRPTCIFEPQLVEMVIRGRGHGACASFQGLACRCGARLASLLSIPRGERIEEEAEMESGSSS